PLFTIAIVNSVAAAVVDSATPIASERAVLCSFINFSSIKSKDTVSVRQANLIETTPSRQYNNNNHAYIFIKQCISVQIVWTGSIVPSNGGDAVDQYAYICVADVSSAERKRVSPLNHARSQGARRRLRRAGVRPIPG
ncbi:MAG: hypothetical protein AAF460_14015, partial [Pseudomonadota bacterium]